MWKILVLIVCSFGLCYSCKKKEAKPDPVVLTEPWELLNGTYKGTIYTWNRNYDTDRVHIIETFDTLRDVSGKLLIDVQANKISFNDVVFAYHDSLRSLRDRDTLFAIFDPALSPYRSVSIVRSKQFVEVYTGHYGEMNSPRAFTRREIYYRQ